MNQIWIIPARYASTRLPGKPLVKIAGVEMLLRVWRVARLAAQGRDGVRVAVATDDERILAFTREHGIDAVMTDPACPSGTDRARQAWRGWGWRPTPSSICRGIIRPVRRGLFPRCRTSWRAGRMFPSPRLACG